MACVESTRSHSRVLGADSVSIEASRSWSRPCPAICKKLCRPGERVRGVLVNSPVHSRSLNMPRPFCRSEVEVKQRGKPASSIGLMKLRHPPFDGLCASAWFTKQYDWRLVRVW